MRVTTLVENDALEGRDDLTAEFGLSLLIEVGSTTILFDTGSTGVFADNAAALGHDLGSVDLAVLSHHHFDHGGGLRRFLELNRKAPALLRGAPLENRWSRALLVIKRAVGIDTDLVGSTPERFVAVDDDTEIAPGVWLLTGILDRHPRPKGNRHLYVEHDGRLQADPFDHELMLVIHEADGMVVFTGCSHHGVLNMVETAAARFPDATVKAVFGGFHLIGPPIFDTMTATPEEVGSIARTLLERVAGPVFTGHCAGRKGTEALAAVMGDRLRTIRTGVVFEV
jgi:7,8-dihydropterin-6-yl-methyl-4-(beta-D-ribofuranosyl)aminobenzene 5'-phosphate synthase